MHGVLIDVIDEVAQELTCRGCDFQVDEILRAVGCAVQQSVTTIGRCQQHSERASRQRGHDHRRSNRDQPPPAAIRGNNDGEADSGCTDESPPESPVPAVGRIAANQRGGTEEDFRRLALQVLAPPNRDCDQRRRPQPR